MLGYFFHVTRKSEWGKEIKLFPRSTGDNRDPDEGDDARICVSTTPWHCCVALGNLVTITSYNNLYIYRTKYAVNAKRAPKQVFDRKITDEYWLIRPTTFVKVDTISYNDNNDADTFNDILCSIWCVGSKDGIYDQRKALPKLRKLFLSRGWEDLS